MAQRVGIIPQGEGSLVRFLVWVHAWVAGLVPDVSLPSPLSKNKYKGKKEGRKEGRKEFIEIKTRNTRTNDTIWFASKLKPG